VRTMITAGRSVVFSGATVALGLHSSSSSGPIRALARIGGFLIPLVSVVGRNNAAAGAALDLRTTRQRPCRVTRRRHRAYGFWHWLARSIMRRPLLFLAGGSAVLLLAAAPAFALRLTPGSADGVPRTLPSVYGFNLCVAPSARARSRRRSL